MKWLDNTNINNDFLMYGLLIGILSLASFGVYSYFNNKINNNLHLDSSTQTFPNQLIKETQTIINTIDTEIQTITNNLVDTEIQTITNNLVDATVQTDNTMLYDYLNDFIMKNMTNESTSMHLTPSEFRNNIRENPILMEDPEWANSFEDMRQWSERIGDPRLTFRDKSSEYNFISALRDSLRTRTEFNDQNSLTGEISNSVLESSPINSFSNVVNDNLNDFSNTFFGINNEFTIKLYHLINQSNHLIDYAKLSNILGSSSLPLIDPNLQVYADLITNMLI